MTRFVPPVFSADDRHVLVLLAGDDTTQSVAPPSARPSSRPATDVTPLPHVAADRDVEATVISQPPAGDGAGNEAGEDHSEQGSRRRPHTAVADVGRALEGTRLGVYELQEFVGGGGMGAVFRGRDTTLDRTVAVKVLFQHRTDDADLLRRFKNEAQSAARLDHENIGRVYAVGSEGGWHYIVFEFIEGVNLRDLVNDRGPFDVARTITITSQLADALAHAETRNVVHRDIKPSNVIITPTGRARLVDMGLARLHQMAGDRDLTVSGMTLGTFDYISPEQARDPRLADVRSDLYSLGCTAYFMLIGRPPFADGTMVQKLLQHQQQQATPVDRLRPDIPREVALVIGRLMEKDPADRYQHPSELVEALSRIAEDRGIELPTTAAAVVRRPKKRPFRPADHLPWLVPTLGFVAIVIALRLSTGERGRADRVEMATDPAGLRADIQPEAEAGVVRHRVVDAPNEEVEAWTEHVSLADAVAAADDGDVIELAFSEVRDEPPIVVVGKKLTIRAAEGARPEVRFSGFATESLARERAGFVLDASDVTLQDVSITLAVSTESLEPAARLFLLREESRLAVERSRLGIEGTAKESVESRRPRCIEVVASPASVGDAALAPQTADAEELPPASTRIELVDTTVEGDMTFLEVTGAGPVALVWTGGSLNTGGRCIVVEGAGRDVEEGAVLAVTTREVLFACREGFACLLDSPARPTEPRLEVTATSSRFLTPEGVPLIEQSGIEDPEVYRGRVRWIDAGSRYEGSPVFRRIDGAAERVEIDFASLAQSMQFLPQIEAWPEAEIGTRETQLPLPSAGETLQETVFPPTAVPAGGTQTR